MLSGLFEGSMNMTYSCRRYARMFLVCTISWHAVLLQGPHVVLASYTNQGLQTVTEPTVVVCTVQLGSMMV